jgi:hypothetical protein
MIGKFGREIRKTNDHYTWYAVNDSENKDMIMYFTRDILFKTHPLSHMKLYEFANNLNLVIALSYSCYGASDTKLIEYIFSDVIINKFDFHDHTKSIVDLVEDLEDLEDKKCTDIYDIINSDYMHCRWPKLTYYV